MGPNYGATVKSSVEFVNASGPDASMYDLSLTTGSANVDCCIDKVTQSPDFTNHDFKGAGRPQRAAFDIGADEVR
jgi:hypothetical protein